MLIVSKKYDYYDSVGKSTGIDYALRYVREPQIITQNEKYNCLYSQYTVYIGFCGKIYKCFRYTDEHFKYQHIYTQEELIEKFPPKTYYKPKRKWRVKELPQKNSFIPKEDRTLFEQYKVPIFTYYYYSEYDARNQTDNRFFELNSNLGQYEFFKVFPPWQAFQEVRMFLSNLAMPEKLIPEMNDLIKRDIKGFDKFSFRKDKQK